MKDHTRILVCSGKCSFWHDNSTGTGCMGDHFPKILSIPGLVQQFCNCDGWLVDMLLQAVTFFVSRFEIPLTSQVDHWVLELEQYGKFTMGFAYNLVRKRRVVWPDLRVVWDQRIPTKIYFFFWHLLNRQLLF